MRVLGGLLAAAAVLSACGGTAPGVASSAAPASLAGPRAALYNSARGEGQVVWYSPEAEDKVAPVIQAFEKAYPGVKVAHTQKTAQQQLPDIEIQQAAHHVTVDVGQAAETNVSQAIAKKIFMPADWVSLGVPANQVLEGGLLKVGATPLAWVYNTQKVPAADAPKSWDELLDPRWAAKMDLDGRGGFMATFLASPELGGAAKGLEFARKLLAQKPLFEASSPPLEAKVIAGEVSLGLDVVSSTLAAQQKKAPVDIAPVSPLNAALAFSFVLDGAPHPAAGKLLAAWLASPEGQAALAPTANSLLGSCGDTHGSATTQAFCSRGIQWVQFADAAQFQQVADYLTQVQQIFGTRLGA
jgi:iron(III) transport system substrate-binding protein